MAGSGAEEGGGVGTLGGMVKIKNRRKRSGRGNGASHREKFGPR